MPLRKGTFLKGMENNAIKKLVGKKIVAIIVSNLEVPESM
jgi:hypothetical protein